MTTAGVKLERADIPVYAVRVLQAIRLDMLDTASRRMPVVLNEVGDLHGWEGLFMVFGDMAARIYAPPGDRLTIGTPGYTDGEPPTRSELFLCEMVARTINYVLAAEVQTAAVAYALGVRRWNERFVFALFLLTGRAVIESGGKMT